MALGPKTGALLEAAAKKIADDLEPKIDNELSAKYEGRGPFRVSITVEQSKNWAFTHALTILAKRYIAAGWRNVTHDAQYGDQRDWFENHFILLTP